MSPYRPHSWCCAVAKSARARARAASAPSRTRQMGSMAIQNFFVFLTTYPMGEDELVTIRGFSRGSGRTVSGDVSARSQGHRRYSRAGVPQYALPTTSNGHGSNRGGDWPMRASGSYPEWTIFCGDEGLRAQCSRSQQEAQGRGGRFSWWHVWAAAEGYAGLATLCSEHPGNGERPRDACMLCRGAAAVSPPSHTGCWPARRGASGAPWRPARRCAGRPGSCTATASRYGSRFEA